jgi:hypothetical protein
MDIMSNDRETASGILEALSQRYPDDQLVKYQLEKLKQIGSKTP